MGLLDRDTEAKPQPVRETAYNADWVYGPAGGITASEINEIKEGERDRETGKPRCAFCRLPKPLSHGDCCDAYCHEQEHGGIPRGKVYHWDKEQRGREWLTLG